jgi:hypothetical protein
LPFRKPDLRGLVFCLFSQVESDAIDGQGPGTIVGNPDPIQTAG